MLKWGESLPPQHDSGIILKRLTQRLLLMEEEGEKKERLCVDRYIKLLRYYLKEIFPLKIMTGKVKCTCYATHVLGFNLAASS